MGKYHDSAILIYQTQNLLNTILVLFYNNSSFSSIHLSTDQHPAEGEGAQYPAGGYQDPVHQAG